MKSRAFILSFFGDPYFCRFQWQALLVQIHLRNETRPIAHAPIGRPKALPTQNTQRHPHG